MKTLWRIIAVIMCLSAMISASLFWYYRNEMKGCVYLALTLGTSLLCIMYVNDIENES